MSASLVIWILFYHITDIRGQFITIWSNKLDESGNGWSSGGNVEFGYNSTNCPLDNKYSLCTVGRSLVGNQVSWILKETDISLYSHVRFQIDLKGHSLEVGDACQIWYLWDDETVWKYVGDDYGQGYQTIIEDYPSSTLFNFITISLDTLGDDDGSDRCYWANAILSGILITDDPTTSPTTFPSTNPSNAPTTSFPSLYPSNYPSEIPSINPSYTPTEIPSTHIPSLYPSNYPSEIPSTNPSFNPTEIPSTHIPSLNPSEIPSKIPSINPSEMPSNSPTVFGSGIGDETTKTVQITSQSGSSAAGDNHGSEWKDNISMMTISIGLAALLIITCCCFIILYWKLKKKNKLLKGNKNFNNIELDMTKSSIDNAVIYGDEGDGINGTDMFTKTKKPAFNRLVSMSNVNVNDVITPMTPPIDSMMTPMGNIPMDTAALPNENDDISESEENENDNDLYISNTQPQQQTMGMGPDTIGNDNDTLK